jgi:leader peptidase (prepilin peptidase)/N-methyltransferase
VIWLMFCYGFIGATVGSFLNVVIDRVPAGESLLRPPSHCPGCGRRLRPWELVPVASYLVLRGRCRECGARIPRRVLAVEAATALFFGALMAVYGPSGRLLLATLYSAVLLVLIVIDLEHKLVPNVIVLPAIAAAVLLLPLDNYLPIPPERIELLGYWAELRGIEAASPWALGVASQLLGGVAAFGLFLAVWLASRGGMGAGAVKLAAFAGLLSGFPGALATVFGSFILGGVAGVALLAARLATRKTAIPFAPFLAVSAWVMMVFGGAVLRWYGGL